MRFEKAFEIWPILYPRAVVYSRKYFLNKSAGVITPTDLCHF